MNITLYRAECTGNAKNCLYPFRCDISDAEDFKAVIVFDHVCAKFKRSYRSTTNFIESNCDVMDCDNDHSDDPADWIYPEKLIDIFGEDIQFIAAPSRHNMKPKDGRSARPRFHVYFPHEPITSEKECAALKKAIHAQFPFFDKNALDAGRFIFGNKADEVLWHDGELTVECILKPTKREIPQGQRNNTMSRFAGRVVKRYGATDRAYNIFLAEASKCSPPLEDDELEVIWKSACKFAKKVQIQEGYISPEDYEFQTESLKPADYSDIGQARIIAREYGDELLYTAATDLLRYNGVFWEESKQKAVGAVIEFLDLQLADASDAVNQALDALSETGITPEQAVNGGKRFIADLNDTQRELYENYLCAKTYKSFVMKRRDMKYIVSALQTLKPMVNCPVKDLDSDPFLLNTPSATYDLRKGISGGREHSPEDKITKVTAFDPSDKGKELWLAALDNFFRSDKELISYVQQMMSLSTLGKVFIEALIIAYGEGGNGKSTFGNAILKTIGTYGGTISADALTVGCKRNVKPELAETKGKRLLIAAELEEGMRLNTSMVKQLCSTDEISAEKKYKDPFHFTPSHTVLLYTNHLPRVGAMDEGIWRRLIVIPFTAKITGDVKNYADYLFENAGEYILKWLIEGAEKVINAGFNITLPTAVKNAISAYMSENDWLTHFLDDKCVVNKDYSEKSGELYREYRSYCTLTGEFIRSTTEFYKGLESRGFLKRRTNKGRFICGLKLKSDLDDD